MKKFMVDGDKIEWNLLRKRKRRLSEITDYIKVKHLNNQSKESKKANETIEYLRGTLHLIDFIQDGAAESGMWTEKEIFGELE